MTLGNKGTVFVGAMFFDKAHALTNSGREDLPLARHMPSHQPSRLVLQ